MKFLKVAYCLFFVLFFTTPLIAQDVLLEFKAACFIPTSCRFKDIYGRSGALYGPELTMRLCDSCWYGFASFDYFHKKGHSIGLCEPTTVTLVPIAFGLKYLVPTNDFLDCYAGLGFEAVNVRTRNCIESVVFKQTQWGFGGIAKLGVFYYLPCNFFLDFFVDYSFVNVGSKHSLCQNYGMESVKTKISGAILGAGVGYRF